MLCRRTESRADHCANHNGRYRFAAEHITKFGCLVEDLIEADSHKIDKHELHDRAQTTRRGADGCPDKGRLGYRSVHDPISEFSVKPFGNTEYAAPSIPFSVASHSSDIIFAHHDDRFITTHFLSDRFVNGLFEINFSRHMQF